MSINYQKMQYVSPGIPYASFLANPSLLKNTLATEGFAVLLDVLDPTECAAAIQLGKDYLATTFADDAHNVHFGRPETYGNIDKTFYAKHHGLMQHFGIGQSEFVWSVRENPKVIKVFELLWGTSNLFTSFDGANITPPPCVDGRAGWQSPTKYWWHTDQSEKKVGLHSIQSSVNLVAVEEGDATLAVLVKSHLRHQRFFKRFGLTAKGDWQLINQDHLDWFLKKDCTPVAVAAPAGAMVFWDSRTIHMGLQPSPARIGTDHWRFAVYVAMFPRSRLVDGRGKFLDRKKYVEEGRTTNHWGTHLFSKNPHTYGGKVAAMRPRESIYKKLTERGRQLI